MGCAAVQLVGAVVQLGVQACARSGQPKWSKGVDQGKSRHRQIALQP